MQQLESTNNPSSEECIEHNFYSIEFVNPNNKFTSNKSSKPSSINSYSASDSSDSDDSENSEDFSLNPVNTVVGFISDLIDIGKYLCLCKQPDRIIQKKIRTANLKRDALEYKLLRKEIKNIECEIKLTSKDYLQ